MYFALLYRVQPFCVSRVTKRADFITDLTEIQYRFHEFEAPQAKIFAALRQFDQIPYGFLMNIEAHQKVWLFFFSQTFLAKISKIQNSQNFD